MVVVEPVADEEAVAVVSCPPPSWPPIDALTQRMEIIDLTEDDQDDDADGTATTMNDEAAGGNGGSPAPPTRAASEASSPFVVEEQPSYCDDYPPLSEERFVFYAAFEELVFLEFQYRGLAVEEALEAMWVAHEWRFGPHCHEGCPCFEYLGELAEQAFYHPHDPHQPHHHRRRCGRVSLNLLSCFVPKFLRRLATEYPHESRRQLGYRLQRMWHVHGAAAAEPYLAATNEFTLPCYHHTTTTNTCTTTTDNNNTRGDNNNDQGGGCCRCHDYWDTLFNRGNCAPLSSYAGVSICDHVDAIRTFCSKFRSIVTAEFAVTEFPDATRFALGRMWRLHVDRFGEQCDATCSCYTVLPDLAATVVGEMLQRQQQGQHWINPLQLTADSVPSGVLLCYARHHNEAFGTAVLQKYLATAVTKQSSRDDIDDDDDHDDSSLPHLAWHKFLWAWPANTGRPCTSSGSCRCQQHDIIMDT
jgi:hypothetical protein